jgi:hypothetical protein
MYTYKIFLAKFFIYLEYLFIKNRKRAFNINILFLFRKLKKMESNAICSTSLTVQKSLAEDVPKSDDKLDISPELERTYRSFNIEDIKQSLLNPKDRAVNVDDGNLKDTDGSEMMRKRSNTWPIKKVDFNASTNDYEKLFAAKMIKELGIDSGKQLKNPWGNLSYSQLIEKAIECSPWKSLSLKEIYSWFTKYVPFFKDKSNYKSTMGWKVCIFLFYLI